MKVGIFHPGVQHSWQTALAFQRAGALAWYATSIFSKPTDLRSRVIAHLPRAIRSRLVRALSRRSYTPLNDARVVEFGGVEWLEIAARWLGQDRLAARLNRIGNAIFERDVAALAGRTGVTAVIGYNTSALAVFAACPPGVWRILDQTIGHPDAQIGILSREFALHPDMFTHDPAAVDAHWIAHQRAEHDAADIILCGSSFCRDTLAAHGVAPAKLKIIPYGFPDDWLLRSLPERPQTGPVRLLFLGTLSARKGAYYLLEAMRGIPAELATLTVIGRSDVPAATMSRYSAHITMRPQVPKAEVFESLIGYDVLVLPTLFEGCALGVCEAIGAGLALIHSRASGHADYGNGIRLDEVSADGVRDAILRLAGDRRLLDAARRRSLDIRTDLVWSKHHRALVDLVASAGRRP